MHYIVDLPLYIYDVSKRGVNGSVVFAIAPDGSRRQSRKFRCDILTKERWKMRHRLQKQLCVKHIIGRQLFELVGQ